MIHTASQKIADFLYSKEIISHDDIEVCAYGYETLISGIFDFLLVLILGLALNKLVCALVFFTMFVTVRLYTGGYHADTYLKCKLIFTLISLSVLVLSSVKFSLYTVFLVITLFGITTLFLAPVKNPNKYITNSEKLKYKKISMISVSAWSIAALITYSCLINISSVIVSTMFFITMLMIIGKYGKDDHYEEEQHS